MRSAALIAATAAWIAALAGCSPDAGTTGTVRPTAGSTASPPDRRATFPPAPGAPDGPLEPHLVAALDAAVTSFLANRLDKAALDAVSASADARLTWVISDLLRFLQGGARQAELAIAFQRLTGFEIGRDTEFATNPWRRLTDILIAWNLPPPPGYRELKARIYLAIEPAWQPFFDDPEAVVDWRLVSWGGVLIDDRPLGSRQPCRRGCIPALDHPRVTSAAEGDWYPDDRIVFGLVVGTEVVALPRNIMEVHEMVNANIGGRRLAIPYCTLCGSAQAYFVDSVPEGVAEPVLRTSGLLSRSNKMMFDLLTGSLIDTFTGVAVSGPLREAGVKLEQATVVVTTWAEWKAAHPETRIVAEDGGIGLEYPLTPLRGRDDNGPIFPIGVVDSRLPVQANVVGVIAPDGTPVAFPVDLARATLAGGGTVAFGDIEIVNDGGGLRARGAGGGELAAHQAFWFAWSQFHPDTVVWSPLAG